LDYSLEGAFKAFVAPQFNVNAKGLGGSVGFGVSIPGVVNERKEFGFGPFLNLGASLPSKPITLLNQSRKVKLSSLVNAVAPKQSFSFKVPGPIAISGRAGPAIVSQSAANVVISNNTLVGTARAEFIDGGANLDALTGGASADVFGFRFGQSPLSAPDLITDFAFGTDKIDVFSPSGAAHVAPTRFSRAANHAFATTPLALAAAVFADANGALPGNQALAANSAVLVRASNASIGGTYLVINNATTGRSDSDDLMIKLTGSTGPLPALGSLLPGTVFV
jgi:hypothetical protein